MKTILRNLFTTLRRFKLASALNILGLSAAFAAFTLIMMQVHHDRSFDRFHPKVDRIYRLEIGDEKGSYSAIVAREWADLIHERLPQVEATGLRRGYSPYGCFISPETTGKPVWYRETGELIHPDFADVFDFSMIEGSRSALLEPDKVLLPQSLAQKYWNGQNAVGKQLLFKNRNESEKPTTVGGVYRDFPQNTLVENAIYYGLDPNVQNPWDGWNPNYELFLSLSPSAKKEDFEQRMSAIMRQSSDVPERYRNSTVRLTALPDIHFITDIEWDPNPKGNRSATAVLLSIALLIVLVAAINFVNFAMSLSPLRIKSINTQKVFGSPVSQLRAGVLGEAAGIALIAYGIGLLIATGIGRSFWASLFDADLSLGAHLPVVWLSLGAALAVGLAAGAYPAFYYTRFAPALVLKGSFGMSSKGRALRTALLGFQYVVSIGLIVAALFMQLQNHYVRQTDKGFDTEQIAVIELNNELAHNRRDELVSRLKENPRIEEVAFSYGLFGTGDTQTQSTKNIEGEQINYCYLPVSEDFLRVMGIHVTEGRDFEEGDSELEPWCCIFNEAGRQALGDIHPGYELTGYAHRIIGFIDNINFRPLQTACNEPFCFAVQGHEMQRQTGMPWVHVKINGNPHTAAGHIRHVIESMAPGLPDIDVRFYDRVFDSIYQKERKTAALVTGFSILAVVISLMGVFGIVMFETQYRRKEIGVRKVFGSTSDEILRMLNRKFALIVLVCFLIAAPAAYYCVRLWLEGFAYRTPMHGWVFAVGLLAVGALTLLTVTVQSYRAANENPIKSLKSE